jgi:hypothetical protein
MPPLIDQVPIINPETRYWFIRANNGEYYDVFKRERFVGIGWNYVMQSEIQNPKLESAIKERIFKTENNLRKDKDLGPLTKSSVTTIYNKLRLFDSMKQGDVVVTPSFNSNSFLIGTIRKATKEDLLNTKFDTNLKEPQCAHSKRKYVEWKAERSFAEIPPAMHILRRSQHAISQINPSLHEYLQCILHPLYRMNNYTYFTLKITASGEVLLTDLLGLLEDVRNKTQEANETYNLGEDVSSQTIKISVHSNGYAYFKQFGTALVGGALLMSGCESPIYSKTPNLSKESVEEARELNVKGDSIYDHMISLVVDTTYAKEIENIESGKSVK